MNELLGGYCGRIRHYHPAPLVATNKSKRFRAIDFIRTRHYFGSRRRLLLIIASYTLTIQKEVNAMPVYEYECLDCHEITEIWQGLAEAQLTTCPSCQGTVKKIISMSSFALKGGGWYADSYSSSPKPSTTPCKGGGCPAATSSAGCPKSSGTSCGSS